MERAIPVLEVRKTPEGVIEGIASAFGRVDSYNHTILPGAYRKSIEAHTAARTTPAMLWAHMQEAPIGRWETLIEDATALRVKGRLNLETVAGREAFAHLRANDITGLSVGFVCPKDGDEIKSDGTRVLREIDLREISVVAVPADQSARITSVKSMGMLTKPETLRQFEDALRTMGFSRREAAKLATKGFANFEPDPDVSELDPQAARAVHAALRSLTSAFKR